MKRSRIRWARLPLAAFLLVAIGAGCASSRLAPRLVILLTDFGDEGSYRGSLKGSIYRVCPDARIDEITHRVPPFDIEEGARILREAAAEYPPGTIFVAVVDPGVGSSRRAIAARDREGRVFIGPDNGLLFLALEAGGMVEAREIDPSRWGSGEAPPSATFHGRDIFGPAAGRVACGIDLSDLGPPAPSIVRLDLPAPVTEGTRVHGRVASIDRYGNLLTDIPIEAIRKLGASPGDILRVIIGSKTISCPWVRTYGDVEKGLALCLENSQGLLEIAENQGSLAARIEAQRGVKVEVGTE